MGFGSKSIGVGCHFFLHNKAREQRISNSFFSLKDVLTTYYRQVKAGLRGSWEGWGGE